MNFFSRALKATVTQDYSKVPRERMVARASNVITALKGNDLSKDKKANLTKELKHILNELDARQDAVDKILDSL